MPKAVKCDLFLYAKDTSCTFQHENVKKSEEKVNWNFVSLCDWFIEKKLNICLGKDELSQFSSELI